MGKFLALNHREVVMSEGVIACYKKKNNPSYTRTVHVFDFLQIKILHFVLLKKKKTFHHKKMQMSTTTTKIKLIQIRIEKWFTAFSPSIQIC